MTREGNSRAELPSLAVVGLLAVAIAIVSTDHWRAGLDVFAAALFTAAVARLALPARRAGPLVVRGRLIDSALLLGSGLAVLILALVVPT